jgi:hypothetical protein
MEVYLRSILLNDDVWVYTKKVRTVKSEGFGGTIIVLNQGQVSKSSPVNSEGESTRARANLQSGENFVVFALFASH